MAAGDEHTVIYGFNVEVPNMIAKMAERNGVKLKTFKVIYELIEDARSEMEALLGVETIESDTGELSVQGVFRITKNELIAGGQVVSGDVRPGYFGRVYRQNKLIGEIEVVNVQAGKVDVSVLHESEIGGLSMKTNQKVNMQIGDKIKFFTRSEQKKTL